MIYNIKMLIIINIYHGNSNYYLIFVSSLLLGITAYSIYTAFGPTSKNLRDPFEEHED